MSKEYFNIALFAADPDFIANCIRLARVNLGKQADGYLLGDEAWPHITLSQFQADTERSSSIWSAVQDLQRDPIAVSFGHIYVLPGVEEHASCVWVGLACIAEKTLMTLQKSTNEKLVGLGIEPLTRTDTYFPHLTWARCHSRTALTISDWQTKDLWQREHPFRLSLGLSNRNGIYRKRLFAN